MNSYIITFPNNISTLRPAVGVVPLGYKKIFSDNQIMIVPNEETSPKVILAFELAARGKTFRQILPILKAEGLISSRGNDLSLSSLHNMLTSPFYIGFIRTSKETYEGQHLPLISKSLYRRVQKKLRKIRS